MSPARIKLKKSDSAGKRFARYMRKGIVYTAIAAFAVASMPDPTGGPELVPRINQSLYKPRTPELLNEKEIFYEEAEQSYKENGSWNRGELRDLQSRYFEYVKNEHISSEELARPMMPLIMGVSASVGIPWRMEEAVAANESDFYKYTVGKRGELGTMQIDTKKNRLTKEELKNIFDERTNLTIGARILKANLEEFHGDVRKAIMAYNAGDERVIRGNVYRATRKYLERAIEHMDNSDSIDKGNGNINP